MINERILQDVINNYMDDFYPYIWENGYEDEKFKWEAVKTFQDNWDSKAPDFAEMLQRSLAQTGNVLDRTAHFPKKMIVFFAQEEPDKVRSMFNNLFAEENDFVERVETFKAEANLLHKKYGEEGKKHFQDENVITTYLWLKYPDKYYIYMFSEAGAMSKTLESDYTFKQGDYENNLRKYMALYDEVCEYLSHDQKLVALVREHITDDCYSDPKLKTLTGDISYYITHTYSNNRRIKDKYPTPAPAPDVIPKSKELTVDRLGEILSEMYSSADKSCQVAAIHIFGITYGKVIQEKSYKVSEIIKKANLNDSYKTELQKGIKIYECLVNNTFGSFLPETSPSATETTACDNKSRITGGTNTLYYGVPGSGKSFTVDETIKKDDPDFSRTERVVFHPDYTYSDFVGQILPQLEGDRLEYVFVPGPFTRILKNAIKDPDQMYYLVIEEINRGNAPAIFGDVFQLLDREDGKSRYLISNYDIAKEIYNDKVHKIEIPSNLTIFATMNTSDQNVFTMDTAFQRRWNMVLIPNDISKADHAEMKIEGSSVIWKAFATVINDNVLSSNEDLLSSEDKRLGAYFVNDKELDKDNFSQKVLKYLWDDAFKMDRTQVFNENLHSLEDVVNEFNKAVDSKNDPLKAILKDDIFRKMVNESTSDTDKESESTENIVADSQADET